jgi:hypothetical protein
MVEGDDKANPIGGRRLPARRGDPGGDILSNR